MHEFICPHCSIPLRVRDDSFRNRTIECPECKQLVLIEETEHGLLGVAAPARKSPSQKSTEAPQKFTLPMWSMAGLLSLGGVLVIAFFLLRPKQPVEPDRIDPREAGLKEAVLEQAELNPVDTGSAPATPAPAHVGQTTPESSAESTVPDDPVSEKLTGIFQLLNFAHQKSGQQAQLIDQQHAAHHSWIASLVASNLSGPLPHWEAEWNAPVNDEFVRRRIPAFTNPLIPVMSGDDHYPATHFVGVSGVGVDAADLPRRHPRAGIFSASQVTRREDVTDGMSNTMLVAGVQSELGSWARPGTASIRSFTREPYLHGPDGFGTGHPNQMFVLMADGSVKTLSAQTEAVVVRRMAAMADGIALDPHVPGDPLTLSAAGARPIVMPAPVQDLPQDLPIEVEMEPDRPVLDLQPRLQQKIVRFELTRPTSFRHVLTDLQELIGVPIDVSALPPEILDLSVKVTLENITVEDILKQLCAISETSYEAAGEKILFSRKPAP